MKEKNHHILIHSLKLTAILHLKMGRIPQKGNNRLFQPSVLRCKLAVRFQGVFFYTWRLLNRAWLSVSSHFPRQNPLEWKNSFFLVKKRFRQSSRKMEDIFPNHLGCTKYPWNIFYVYLVGGFSPNLFFCKNMRSRQIWESFPANFRGGKRNVWNPHLHLDPPKNRTSFQLLHPLAVLLPKRYLRKML